MQETRRSSEVLREIRSYLAFPSFLSINRRMPRIVRKTMNRAADFADFAETTRERDAWFREVYPQPTSFALAT